MVSHFFDQLLIFGKLWPKNPLKIIFWPKFYFWGKRLEKIKYKKLNKQVRKNSLNTCI